MTNARRRLLASAALVAAVTSTVAACGPEATGSGPGTSPSATGTIDPAQASSSTSSTPASSASTTPTAAASPATSAKTKGSAQQAIDAARPRTALAVLGTIAVKGRAPRTGYDRDLFGQAWADVDRNGCDTRNDVLRRDLRSYVLKAGTHGCLVLSGTLHDPYTGRTIHFVRGQRTSIAVQIDHVVALSDAWQKGAQKWSTGKRKAFANDPLNLLAVDGPTNAGKGDGDAATWLPPSKSYRCSYVARQVAVKHAYGLWMTAAERTASAGVLAKCPGQKLPTAGAIRLGGGTVAAAPAPSTSTTTSSSSVYYQNCDAVRAAGKDPLYRGDPGYSRKLDRDGDGVACE